MDVFRFLLPEGNLDGPPGCVSQLKLSYVMWVWYRHLLQVGLDVRSGPELSLGYGRPGQGDYKHVYKLCAFTTCCMQHTWQQQAVLLRTLSPARRREPPSIVGSMLISQT